MIYDKEKVEKIYNYLSDLAKAHKSSANKYNGWTLYNKNDKKLGFRAQLFYKYDSCCKNMEVELYDVDFNQKTNFWTGNSEYKRIYVSIRISKDFSELEVKEFMLKDGAELISFFRKLDEFVNNFEAQEFKLEQLLLRKVGE